MPSQTEAPRAQWNSRLGFVLAAAGSAVGLGNIWRFPYIAGENGGGAFVLVYLLCILLVGAPVMIAEILLGRASQASPVTAFRSQSRPGSPWIGVGLLGVLAAFLMISYYSTVAGWAMHYSFLSVTNEIAGKSAEQVQGLFDAMTSSLPTVLGWQLVFLLLTFGMVVSGVTRGIERWARIMMPGLFILLLVLVGNAMTMDGWGKGIEFLFGMRADNLTGAGVLEALGQSFFSLSLGMGSMITYGSYLSTKDDLVSASLLTAGTDTMVALVASMVVFPIAFTFALQPEAGPGLAFVSIPTALAQMAGGSILSVAFFVMLVFAALTSAIAIVEVLTAYLVDDFGISRKKACLIGGLAVIAVGVPPSVSGDWFGKVDYFVSNIALPLGGLGVAVFVAWRMNAALRRGEFESGSRLAKFYGTWLWFLKYPAPVCIVLVFLRVVGVV